MLEVSDILLYHAHADLTKPEAMLQQPTQPMQVFTLQRGQDLHEIFFAHAASNRLEVLPPEVITEVLCFVERDDQRAGIFANAFDSTEVLLHRL